MRSGRTMAALGLFALIGGCHADQGPSECTLQMLVVADPVSVEVGGTVQLRAGALSMLPPGRSCGAPTVTWSLSDSALASVESTGQSTATLRGLEPGVVAVAARGTAEGRVDIESVDVTITGVGTKTR